MTAISLPAAARRRVNPVRVGLAMTARDLRVLLRRQIVPYLMRVLVLPLLLLFTFCVVLPATRSGVTSGNSALGTIIIPGILASTIVFTGVMGVTVPLSAQLTFPREIDDRLLMPIPDWGVAVQKVVTGVLQSLLAAALVIPLVVFVHAPGQRPHLHVSSWPLLVVVFVSTAVLASCLGLLIGTVLDPMRMNMLFSVIMTPALMLGCMYYSWESLASLRWLQIVVLADPIVYMSEAFRAVLTPTVAHMPTWGYLPPLTVGSAAVLALGLVTFRRRVRR
jgi:ABC-2 type transport system permease protein